MSPTFQRRKAQLLVLLLLTVMVLSLTLAGSASATRSGPYNRIPGYPKYGCYDIATSGIGMWDGNSQYWMELNVPGPVVDAYMIWIGTEDDADPGSPDQSILTITNNSLNNEVTGQKVDTRILGPTESPWYMWRTNLGPGGYDFIHQGYNAFGVSGWGWGPLDTRRNGVSVIVVYDTGACTRANQVELLDSMDWYWERWYLDVTTTPIIYTFPPALVDREATVWLDKAGTDSLTGDNPCRPENIWAATGTGTPPTNFINISMNPSIGENGGILVVKDGFTQTGCPISWYPPVTDLLGFLPGQGVTPNVSGYISDQWAMLRLKIKVPAGATWLAVQGESVRTDPNQVGVTASGESGAWTGQFVLPLYNPELKITKAGPNEAQPGDTFTYTLGYDNHGYVAAENTTIVDKLPPHVTYVSSSNGGVYNNATRTVTWNLGSLAINQAGQVTLTVKVDPVLEAGTYTLTNEATISTTTPGELDPSDNTASTATSVTAKVELNVAKVAVPEPVDAGNDLTYTIDWTVGGNAYAHGVTIVDTLPPIVTFKSASDGGVYDPNTRTVTWSLGEVTPVKQGTYTVVVNVPSPQYNGTRLTNNVVLSDTAGNMSESSTTSTIRSSHVLTIEKLAAPEPVEAGNDLTYTVNWSITGNEPADNATIVDKLPALVTFKSASNGGVYDPVAGTVTWALGTVMQPTSGTYTVVVNVPSPQYNGTKITNTVDLKDDTPGSMPAHAAVTSTIHSSHELAIEKLAAPEPVDAGNDLTYTINWSITGNEPADNATIVDTLPAIVVFKSASDGGVYDPVAGTVTWALGTVAPPKSGTFTVVVNVPSPQYNGILLTNTVDLMDDTPGSTPAQSTVVTTVRADHQLIVSKTADPDPVAKGADLTYKIDWSVTGNEPADNVVITDPVPFGTRFVSASGGGIYDPATNTVTWTLGNKVPGDAGSVTMVVNVNRDFPNNLDIINRVTIRDDKKEAHGDSSTTVIQTGAIGDTVWYDLNADGFQDPDEPGISGVEVALYADPDGQCGIAGATPLASTVTDANGKYRFDSIPAGSYCVAVVDATLPAGVTLVSGTNPHGPIALLAGQNYRDADFGYLPEGGMIGNLVWSDANGDGVQDAGEIGIGNVTLDLIKAGADGTCDAADATIVDSAITAGDGSYLFGGLAAGTYCVKVTDTNNVVAGWTLTTLPNPTDPIVLADAEAYLDADFGYQPPTPLGTIGDLVFYDANRNGVYEPGSGETGIGGVTLSLLAADAQGNFTVVVATTTTDASGAYSFTGVPDGDYHVVVTDTNGRLTGYTQTYGLPDTNDNGQVSPFPVTIAGGNSVLYADFGYADGHLLSVTKTNNVPAGQPVEAGAEMIYTIGYSASGREPAPGVVLTDTLPYALEFFSASGNFTWDPITRVVNWSLGDLNPGDSGFVTLTVRVKKPWQNNSFIINTVVIEDRARVRDEATDIVRVHAAPILGLIKTVDPVGTVKPGDTLTYSLCFGNSGNGMATNVVLWDAIPEFTTVVVDSWPPGVIYDPLGRTLTLPIGNLPPMDAPICGSFKVTVDLDIPGVTETPLDLSVDNIARLTSSELPPQQAETSNPLNAFVKPTLTKTADPVDGATVVPGDTITYELCYANEGNANLNGVVLTDVIPYRTEFVPGSATGTGVVYDEATKTLTWTIGTLGPGANACVTFQVTIPLTLDGVTEEDQGWTVENTATLKSDQVVDKTASTSHPLNAFVKPTLTKTADPVDGATVLPGDTITYELCYANEGTANLTGVVLTDAIPGRTNYVDGSVTGGGGYDPIAKAVIWTIDTLGPGANACVTFQVTIPLTLDGVTEEDQGWTVENIAILKNDQVGDKTDSTSHPLNAFVKPVLTKTADPADGATVLPGDTITYELCYANEGTANLTGVVLTDTIPNRTEFVPGSATGGVEPDQDGILTWMIGTLGPGADACGTFQVEIPLTLDGVTEEDQGWTVDNTATLKNDQVGDKTDSTSHPLNATVKPRLEKTADPADGATVLPGGTITYTLRYKNEGTANLTGVVLTDTIPNRTEFVPGSATGGIEPDQDGILTWTIGTLGPGADVSVTFKVTIPLTLDGVTEEDQGWTVDNTATLTNEQVGDKTDSTSHPLNATVKPTLIKTVVPVGTVKPGDTLTYKLCYSNTGTANLTGVVLTDPIPNRTDYVAGSATDGGVYDAGAKTLTWTIGTLGPGVSKCVTFQVKIPLTLDGVTEEDQGWTVDNKATLKNDQVGDKTYSTSNHLNAFVKPTLTKTADPSGTVKPGDTITYELCYANEGTANLTGVVLTDVIPANTKYVDLSATEGGVYDAGAKTLTWTVGTLGPSASKCVKFQVTVNMIIEGLTGQAEALSFAEWNALAITNTATLKNDQVGDKTATIANELNATVVLKIYKAVDHPMRLRGEMVVFTVTVTNNGTATATNVVLTDVISDTLENPSMTSSKGGVNFDPATRTFTVNVGELAPNETVTLVIRGMTARVPVTDGMNVNPIYTIINTAKVAFKEGAARLSNPVTVDVVYFLPGEIPEPGTWLMLGSGLAGLAGYATLRMRTRRRK